VTDLALNFSQSGTQTYHHTSNASLPYLVKC